MTFVLFFVRFRGLANLQNWSQQVKEQNWDQVLRRICSWFISRTDTLLPRERGPLLAPSGYETIGTFTMQDIFNVQTGFFFFLFRYTPMRPFSSYAFTLSLARDMLIHAYWVMKSAHQALLFFGLTLACCRSVVSIRFCWAYNQDWLPWFRFKFLLDLCFGAAGVNVALFHTKMK